MNEKNPDLDKTHRLETDVWHKKRAESAFKTARSQRALYIKHRFLTDDVLHTIALRKRPFISITHTFSKFWGDLTGFF